MKLENEKKGRALLAKLSRRDNQAALVIGHAIVYHLNKMTDYIGLAKENPYLRETFLLKARGQSAEYRRIVADLQAGEDRWRFFHPTDDSFSKAVSAVASIRRAHNIGAEMDSGFDGGEFSAPAHARMEERDIEKALAALGYTPDSYSEELKLRKLTFWAYKKGLLI